MTWPAEAVPDGTVLAPHHATLGLLAALVALLIVWDDDPDREPVGAFAGVLVALVGFLLVWPAHPVVGAVLTHAGAVVALVALLRPGFGFALGPRVVATVSVLVALDDVVEHAWAVPTPLDSGWHVLGPWSSTALFVVAVVAAAVALGRSGGENHA
ncbi:hypothetical protein SAMN04488063_0116 [Halopelagius inordinatus]|uniref:Uncharacterized protein n=1 Tax=Halopelagius inordinatus TaxID=553467 RepID=A0A1I2X7E0_9EURY|nr:hypothetical protein [Halopelagius inordinatus]SFH07881.1 hypothetical protein SAMN04488063_0116 [Halopelagius inordinatus]